MDLIQRHLAFYREFGFLPPVSGGEGETTPGATGPAGPTGPAAQPAEKGGTGITQPGSTGGSFQPITSQEEFDRVLHGRLERKADEVKRELTATITASLKAELEQEATAARLKEQGEYKAIAENFETKVVPDLKLEIEGLKTKLATLETRLAAYIKADEEAVEEDLKAIPEAMRKLMPDGLDLARKQDWVTKAKEAAGVVTKADTPTPRRRDPKPTDINATAPELVRQEFQRSGVYRPPL